jgi:hypothetical protein
MVNTLKWQQHKPFYTGIEIKHWLDYLKRINVIWWLIRIPMILLALPASYGVASFAGANLPNGWASIAGAAFESTYLGAVAIADQMLEAEQKQFKLWFISFEYNPTAILWWLVNATAVIFSVLSNLLFFAAGKYANITPEILTHAVPAPVLGFVYALLVHRYTSQLAAKYRQEFEAKPYGCDRCGARFERIKQLNGHKAQCRI